MDEDQAVCEQLTLNNFNFNKFHSIKDLQQFSHINDQQ